MELWGYGAVGRTSWPVNTPEKIFILNGSKIFHISPPWGEYGGMAQLGGRTGRKQPPKKVRRMNGIKNLFPPHEWQYEKPNKCNTEGH